ncbi:MAG: SDR family NAD(P)-dependent oxidoreductase [Bradyrhizobium sp.]
MTGANSGIGKVTAIALGRAGTDVVVNFTSEKERADEVVSEIRQLGCQAYAERADVADEAGVESMFRRMIEEFGTIDILVNNAGIKRDSAFHEMAIEQWSSVIGVNLTGQFLCAREAIREFLRRGVKPSVSCAAGKIVCMSSVHETIPWARHANYAASKGGVMLMMKSLAQEVAPHHIRVNSVAPGAVRSPINKSVWETSDAYARLMELVPYKRIGEPDDIARAVVCWHRTMPTMSPAQAFSWTVG